MNLETVREHGALHIVRGDGHRHGPGPHYRIGGKLLPMPRIAPPPFGKMIAATIELLPLFSAARFVVNLTRSTDHRGPLRAMSFRPFVRPAQLADDGGESCFAYSSISTCTSRRCSWSKRRWASRPKESRSERKNQRFAQFAEREIPTQRR